MAGFWLERVRYNDDAYYQQITGFFAYTARDIELTAGIRGALWVRPFWQVVRFRTAATTSR